MSDALSLARAVWGRVAPFVPGLILRKLYPVRKQRECLDLSVVGRPHIYIVQGYRKRVQHLQIKFTNQLPFPVELECLTLKYSIRNRKLFVIQLCVHRQVEGYSKIEESLEHELNESQSQMLSEYLQLETVDISFDIIRRTRAGLLTTNALWQGTCELHRTPD